MKTRIYIDTSVLGGFFDEEFQEDTKRFYKWFEENDVVFVISDLYTGLNCLKLKVFHKMKNICPLFLIYPLNFNAYVSPPVFYFFSSKVIIKLPFFFLVGLTTGRVIV